MLKTMYNFKIRLFAVFIIILIVATVGLYSSKKEVCFTGETMGTTYDIKVITGLFNSKLKLKTLVDSRLSDINESFSTYEITSEISQFNSITDLEYKFYPSHDFLTLLSISRELYELVGDVWDPTVDSLVNAWGFGRDGPTNCILKSDDLNSLLDKVDFKKAIIVCDDGSIKKGFVDASIDFASIAKGFGVDQIAILLYKKGFDNFLVEIGGEIYAKGFRKDGQCWRVGINYPSKTTFSNEIYKVLSLSDSAIATSGDYRNFIKINDETYSHIIDPRTGYPISNYVTSASVIAENCTIADGLATSLMILDPEEALVLVNSLPLVECIITTLGCDGILKSYSSSGIETLQQ